MRHYSLVEPKDKDARRNTLISFAPEYEHGLEG